MMGDPKEDFKPLWFDHDGLLLVLSVFTIPFPIMLYLRYKRHGQFFPKGRPTVHDSLGCLFNHKDNRSTTEAAPPKSALADEYCARSTSSRKEGKFNDIEYAIRVARADIIRAQAQLYRCKSIKENYEAQKLIAKGTFQMVRDFNEIIDEVRTMVS